MTLQQPADSGWKDMADITNHNFCLLSAFCCLLPGSPQMLREKNFPKVLLANRFFFCYNKFG